MFFSKKKKKEKQVEKPVEFDIEKVTENSIEMKDEEGKTVYFEPKGTFRFEKRKKDYLIFEEVGTSRKPKMIVTSYTYVNGEFDLKTIVDEEELKEISKEANSLLDELKK